MSRLCAKPTCSDVAERWFDVNAAHCQVVERREATASSIALCGSHAARFSAPDGWEWVGLDPNEQIAPVEAVDAAPSTDEVELHEEAPGVAASNDAAQDQSEPAPRRMHTRDAPWFLANANDDAPVEQSASHDSANYDDAPDVPSAGSLLHRAFHGPDREVDSARAREADRDQSGRREPRTQRTATADGDDDGDVATVRDLASRRNARPPATSYDVELPFPPLDAEPHVAVS